MDNQYITFRLITLYQKQFSLLFFDFNLFLDAGAHHLRIEMLLFDPILFAPINKCNSF